MSDLMAILRESGFSHEVEAADEIERLTNCIRAMTDQNAALVWERDELKRKTEMDYAIIAGDNALQTGLKEEIERLRTERDALKKDAERYRWLRGKHGLWFPPYNDWYDGADADEVIDAAMEESK